jgi:hypothetical protein
MSGILLKTMYSVVHRENLVYLKVGDKELKMDGYTAMRMAAMLGHSGKQARAYTGDYSNVVFGIGTLTDATADALEIQKRKDPTAVFLK